MKIENTRLDYMHNNQSQLRAELYHDIMDTMNSAKCNAYSVGYHIILPPSFISDPRDMKKGINAMALVQRYVKPDIFLIITCNPNLIEIKDKLAKRENRPYVVSRIFQAKIVVLKKQLKEKKFRGNSCNDSCY